MNKQEQKEYHKKYNKEHKEKFREYRAKYRKAHREELRESGREYSKKYHKEHKIKERENAVKYYHKHEEEMREKNRKYHKGHRDEMIERMKRYHKSFQGRYNAYKHDSKRKNRKWDLTQKEFKSFWQKPCYYCGGEIKTIGLDRIDSEKDYTLDNLVPCCKWCNIMKNNYTKEEFIKHCKKITSYN